MPENAELRRDRELAARSTSKGYQTLLELFSRIQQGFRDQAERADLNLDYWDLYNAVLNEKQSYLGNSDLYVPIVRGAIQARKTRFLNQIFPASGRYIDATSSDGAVPHEIVALLEDYVRTIKLRTQLIAALLRNGDVEGHYHLYCDWNRQSRYIVERQTAPPRIQLPGMANPIDTIAGEPIEKMSAEEWVDDHPTVEILHDNDVLVLPTTAHSIDDALWSGGSVTIIRRWTREQLELMIERGEVRRSQGEQLLELSSRAGQSVVRATDRHLLDAAGIRSRGRYFQVYETWSLQPTSEGTRLAKMFYGGYDLILSCRRNPMWNDKCQLISCPQEKVTGVFKGQSPLAGGVDSLQYHANDIANQAADSATYSMQPIVLVDPAKNPRTSTMMLNLGAIWECDPNSVRFAEFPKLWQDGIAIIQNDMQMIFQMLGVNPAMLPQSTGRPGQRRNQAEVAMEQTVDILTTSEACSVLEEGVLSPMLQLWVDYDHQFRDADKTVRTYGELGSLAKLESVPVLQNNARFAFSWFGVEQARNQAQMQQQIAFLNVARGLSQDLQRAGYMLDPAPALEHAAGNIFGWRLGRLVIKDMRQQLAMEPQAENDMMTEGFDVGVHPLDPDPQHIQAHMPLLQHPDPQVAGAARIHIQRHQQQQGLKAQAQMMQQMQQAMGGQGGPGGPPGGPPGQPGAGPPQPGGQVAGPRLMRGPPGTIHPDQLARAGALVMPRRAG